MSTSHNDKILFHHCGSNSPITCVVGSLLQVSHFQTSPQSPSHRQTSFTTWRVKLFRSARHTPARVRKRFHWTLASGRQRTTVTGRCRFARGRRRRLSSSSLVDLCVRDCPPPPSQSPRRPSLQAEGPAAGLQDGDGHPGRGPAQRLQAPCRGRRTVRAHPQGGDTRRQGHLLPGLGQPPAPTFGQNISTFWNHFTFTPMAKCRFYSAQFLFCTFMH